MKALVIDHLFAEDIATRLRHDFPTLEVVTASDSVTARASSETSEIIMALGMNADEALFRNAQSLRWVQSLGAGVDKFQSLSALDELKLLTNAKGIHGPQIAELTMLYMISLLRDFPRLVRQQEAKSWQRFPGRKLEGRSILIWGLGTIGEAIARLSKAFGMQVYAVDPIATEIPGVVEEVWNVDRLNDLLALSDFTVIAAPHTPQTEKLFRTAQFQHMKSSAYLINIGRGAIVDLNDLTAALQNGDIAGAALDVFEIEPLPREHPLWSRQNVIITPHIAAASTRVPERHLETLLENLRCFLTNKPFITLADKQNWF